MAALLVLTISVVAYASFSGYLRINGSVRRLKDCKLNIEASENVNPNSTVLWQADSSVIATVDAATRETLSFSTNLVYSAPAKEITFQIQNVGTCVQQLGNLIINRAPSNGVVVSWPDLNGIILSPGDSTGTRTITVAWTSSSIATSDEVMSAQIHYLEVAP